MAKECGEKAIVAAVDMDANYDLVRDFRVRLMPTQVFLWPDGKEFFRNEGVLEREDIRVIFSKMGIDTGKSRQLEDLKDPARPTQGKPIPQEARQ